MPSSEHLSSLYSYHFDTILRLLERAEELSEEEYRRSPGYGRGSVHDLLFHVLSTDRSWRRALGVGERPAPLDQKEYPDAASLRGLLKKERVAWEELLAELVDPDIDEAIEVTAGPDRVATYPRWRILHHVLLHGTQHQSEIAQLLTQMGRSPGDIDFIFYS